MANYYNETSFIVPGTEDQIDMALSVYESLNAGLLKTDLELLLSEDEGCRAKLLRHYFTNHPDQTDEFKKGGNIKDATGDLGCSFVMTKDTGNDGSLRLWFTHHESINDEAAAVFVQAFLLAFDSPALINFSVSYRCSRPRIGSSGGFSWSVSKNHCRYYSDYTFTGAEERAAQAGLRYYPLRVTAHLEGRELVTTEICACSEGESPGDHIDGLLMSLYGEGLKDDHGIIWFDGDLTIDPAEVKLGDELLPYEYELLSEYL